MKEPCFNTTLLELQAVLGVENLLERLNSQFDLLTELESHWSLTSPLTKQQLGLMHGLWATFGFQVVQEYCTLTCSMISTDYGHIETQYLSLMKLVFSQTLDFGNRFQKTS